MRNKIIFLCSVSVFFISSCSSSTDNGNTEKAMLDSSAAAEAKMADTMSTKSYEANLDSISADSAVVKVEKPVADSVVNNKAKPNKVSSKPKKKEEVKSNETTKKKESKESKESPPLIIVDPSNPQKRN